MISVRLLDWWVVARWKWSERLLFRPAATRYVKRQNNFNLTTIRVLLLLRSLIFMHSVFLVYILSHTMYFPQVSHTHKSVNYRLSIFLTIFVRNNNNRNQ
jgi:hypothetical protein